MDIAAGQYFTYQAQGTISPTNPSMSSIIAGVGQEILPDYTIEDSSVEGSGFLSSIAQAFSPSGIEFEVTLTVLSNLDSDTGSAKTDLDQAFADVTGYSLTSSVITGVQGKPTNQPSQVGTSQGGQPSTPCAGTSVLGICLNTSDTFLIFIVVIVVVLIAAVIISPGTPVAVARSFAG